uniref:Uncharacterized protein n=1 Tax=Janibacter limosus TaxID=53458 RepID=A0AC61U128_9MICO|nr:hypothetical protein [Janibacter limosus]
MAEQDPRVLLQQLRVSDPAHRLLEPHQLIGLAQRQIPSSESSEDGRHPGGPPLVTGA